MTTATEKGYGNLLLMEKSGDGIARITFNRQEKRNAMSSALQAEFRAALRDSWDCKVVTITGGDGPAFCAGVDLAEGRERREREGPGPREWHRSYEESMGTWERTNYMIWEHPACCIASVNGFAIAGGMSVVCSCDLAIASERAEFGMTEMGFGTFPGLVAPLTSKIVNKKHLAQFVYTVQRQDAQTALRMGLVNWVVPHEQLKEKTEELAQRVNQLDPVRIENAKKAINLLPQLDWTAASRHGGTIGSSGANITDISANRDRFLAGQGGMGQGTAPR